ncbi:MAG: ABC transporter permease, partial [Thermoplasmataceae archaeon]
IFGVINLVNLPLLFVSYAMFPPGLMAGWLSDAAKYNPVSWSAETIRTVVINGTLTASQMGSIELWLGGLAILATILLLMAYFVSEKEIRE